MTLPVSCPRRRLQSVIFDMDGVIIDSHPAHRKAWHEFLGVMGRDVSDKELDFILDGRKRREILRHFLGQLSEEQLNEYGNRKDEFFQQAALELTLIPGVVEFLISLRECNINVGLATSASESRTRSTLERLQLTRYFEVVVTGNDVTEGKPDPAIYHLVCRKLNVDPQNAVAIEDAVSGILAASSVGLKCVGVGHARNEERLRAAGAHQVIPDFVGISPGHLDRILA